MASVFRRRITNSVISILQPFLKTEDNIVIYDTLPLSLKLSQPKLLPPQFELSWKDVVKLKPELQNRIHINTVMTYLKNQEFPTSYGVTDIFPDSGNQEKIVFKVDQEMFSSSVLLDIINRIEMIPSSSCFFKNVVPENVVVEYSSPNIAKPFHFGHFRSTIVGNFIANICSYVGHKVTKLNYVGDWGLQYGILAEGFNRFGSEEMLLRDPLNHLFQVYKEANEQNTSSPTFKDEAKLYFKKMEEGDVESLALWKRLRDLSLKEMEATYKRLNIHFDEIHGEAMYANSVEEIYNVLLKEGIASCREDGSIDAVIDNEGDKIDKAVLRKSDGTSLYLSRDLAAAIDRQKKYHFDSLYYVVDSTQRQHFKHLFHILQAMGYSWASDLHYVPFGRILNFNTRKGNVVFLHDILDEAKERTKEGMENSPNTKVTDNFEEVADILGISSLIINDFSVRRKRNYPFDWDKVLNMKGNSGITLQYCNARLNNIKENCGVDLSLSCEFTCLTEPEAISLIQHLARFDEVIYYSYTELEPCVLVHYLFTLRSEVGRAIKVLNVKGSSLYVAKARLLLFHTAHLVFQKSLQLLGITPLNKM
ncbi:probable arginine--tRNA ligase, mitochondrial [Trichonephila clavata]|uniref:Probable arginine--tRNA ligase, mitochondrial n=2 Tax=Trichonephila clavata TaxID=2740835 RepID=A0A8X6KU23_TRICU|nr:probable arginine--tRNA ligase, mitochondrial [Trichonephila clavata]